MHKILRPQRYRARKRRTTRLTDTKSFQVKSIVSVDDTNDQSDGSTQNIDQSDLFKQIEGGLSDCDDNWEIVEDGEEDAEEGNGVQIPPKVPKKKKHKLMKL